MDHTWLTLGGTLPTFYWNNSRKPRTLPFSEHRLYQNGTKKIIMNKIYALN